MYGVCYRSLCLCVFYFVMFGTVAVFVCCVSFMSWYDVCRCCSGVFRVSVCLCLLFIPCYLLTCCVFRPVVFMISAVCCLCYDVVCRYLCLLVHVGCCLSVFFVCCLLCL